MAIALNKAEEIAKAMLKEYFARPEHTVSRDITARLGLSGILDGKYWSINVDVYPDAIRPLDPKSRQILDDGPETRSKTWITVLVDTESGAATIQEKCKLRDLL